jgi:hypothetical protein
MTIFSYTLLRRTAGQSKLGAGWEMSGALQHIRQNAALPAACSKRQWKMSGFDPVDLNRSTPEIM